MYFCPDFVLPAAPYAAYGQVQYPHTQPFFAYAQYHEYSRPPGYLKLGYFRAKSAVAGYGAGYSAYGGTGSGLNPAYYYSGSRSYFGPWYKPAPLALPAPYIPSKSSYSKATPKYAPPPPHHPSSSSYSPSPSYARRMGMAPPADLTGSASTHAPFAVTEVPDFSGHGGYVLNTLFTPHKVEKST